MTAPENPCIRMGTRKRMRGRRTSVGMYNSSNANPDHLGTTIIPGTYARQSFCMQERMAVFILQQGTETGLGSPQANERISTTHQQAISEKRRSSSQSGGSLVQQRYFLLQPLFVGRSELQKLTSPSVVLDMWGCARITAGRGHAYERWVRVKLLTWI